MAASASSAASTGQAQIARTKRWTADEAQRFGELMVRSRKDVARVAKELGSGRTVGDCLGFYYGRWKMTDAYRALKAQMRADRKAGMINVGVSARDTRSGVLGNRAAPRRSAGGPRASARRRGGVLPPVYTTKPFTPQAPPAALVADALELRSEVTEEDGWQNPLRSLRPPPADIIRAATSLRGGVCTYAGHDWYVCTGGDTLESVAGELELAADVLCCVNEAARRAGALKNTEVTPSHAEEKPIMRGFRPEAGAPLLLPTCTQVKQPPLDARAGREGSIVDFELRRWYVCRAGETCATVARSLSGACRFDVSIREDDDAHRAMVASENALNYLAAQNGDPPIVSRTTAVKAEEPPLVDVVADDRIIERAARLVAEAMAVPSLISVRKDTALPARTCLPLPEDDFTKNRGWPAPSVRVAPPIVEAEADRAALRNGDVLVEASGRRWAAARRGESQQQAARRFGVDARRVAKENDLTPWGSALRRGAVPEGAPLLIPEPGAAARDRDESPRPHTVRRSPASRTTSSVTSPSRPAPLACSACRLLGGSASRCRRELRHAAPPYSLPPDVGTRVRVRWLPEGEDENGHHKRASWYFATATSVGEETAEGIRKVIITYDDGGGDDEIEWPDADAISLPKDLTNLSRAATVSERQRELKGQAFKLQGDARDYRVNDVFYSVEEGIDGVVVQYYNAGLYKDGPGEDAAAFEWVAFDDFEARATVANDSSQFGRGARRARSPRASLEGRSDSPPRKKRR